VLIIGYKTNYGGYISKENRLRGILLIHGRYVGNDYETYTFIKHHHSFTTSLSGYLENNHGEDPTGLSPYFGLDSQGENGLCVSDLFEVCRKLEPSRIYTCRVHDGD